MKRSLIHVNQHVLRANKKNGADNPMLTCKQGRANTYSHDVVLHGPSRFVNSMNKPLSCGARVWVETMHEVSFVKYDASHALRRPDAELTIIRVNQQAIRDNLKHGTNLPVLLCVRNGKEEHAHALLIHGPARVRTANPLHHGDVSIWVETAAAIELVAPEAGAVHAVRADYCEQEH